MDGVIIPPIYDGKESMTKYMLKFEKYRSQISKKKYTIVLNFINELTCSKYKSLTEFKNVKEITLLQNKKHNFDSMNKFKEIYGKEFGFNLISTELGMGEDNLDDKNIIQFLTKILSVINYIFVKKEVYNHTLYSIRLE